MIGDNLRTAREETGMTQKELAEKMQIKHYQQIGRWERNEIDISIDNLKKIAKALNKTLDELAGD
jgi:transcriptional regulator with XRE-family HTH domain